MYINIEEKKTLFLLNVETCRVEHTSLHRLQGEDIRILWNCHTMVFESLRTIHFQSSCLFFFVKCDILVMQTSWTIFFSQCVRYIITLKEWQIVCWGYVESEYAVNLVSQSIAMIHSMRVADLYFSKFLLLCLKSGRERRHNNAT